MLLMCFSLKELSVILCDNMSDRGFLEGIGSLHELTSLLLHVCANVTAQAWSKFLHRPSMNSIVLLDLSYCYNLDDEGLNGIAKRCNYLTFFMSKSSGLTWTWNVNVCERLWAKFIIVCIYRCIHLKELNLRLCGCVTDAGICMVIRHCNQLCVLNLIGLEHITGMCALCEYPKPTLCFITLWCTITLQQVRHWWQRPTTGPYC